MFQIQIILMKVLSHRLLIFLFYLFSVHVIIAANGVGRLQYLSMIHQLIELSDNVKFKKRFHMSQDKKQVT